MKNLNEYINIIEKHDLNLNGTKIDEPIIEYANGAELVDVYGNRYIDLSEICVNIGHSNDKFIKNVTCALKKLSTEKSIVSEEKAELFKNIIKHIPPNLDKIFLASSGSEVVEWAMKIAKRHTLNHEILSFWGGLHGRTYAAASMTGVLKRKYKYGPLMPGCVYAPYPNCYRCPFGKQKESCNFYCIDFLDMKLNAESSGQIAAMIIEPFQTITGIVFPPDGYLKRIFSWAKEREIIIILDEIQSGFGRTGKMFGFMWEDVEPDMLCIGKAMGNGMHIGGLCMPKKIAKSLLPYELAGGTGGNAVSCAAANAVFEIIEQENILEKVQRNGQKFLDGLNLIKEKYDKVGDVRGRGLALAIEFVKDYKTKEPLKIVEDIARYACKNGLYMTGSGHILNIRPPLAIDERQVDKSLEVLEAGIKEVLKYNGQ